MQTPDSDTISAIVTPPGTGGIAVIRLSGPASIPIVDNIFRGTVKISTAAPNTVHFGRIVDGTGAEVDEVLASVFRSPHSYTAEDVVEVSCHGSPYIARLILDLVIAGGARPAGPGEFTRRAFLNGRIDLSQAEAVSDLINAESRASHDLAIALLRGTLSTRIASLREKIVDLCSTLELELDFSEEGLEFIRRDDLQERLTTIEAEITQIIDSFELGKIYSEGLRIVLAGSPNVGKSSILNALLREERAIVTDISGTTRDTIEESILIAGMKYTIVDTAGLRTSNDVVEAEGIRRTREQLSNADLTIVILDPTREIDYHVLGEIANQDPSGKVRNHTILVLNKVDLADPEEINRIRDKFPGERVILTSAIKGMGIQELEREISSRFKFHPEKTLGESIVISNVRQRESLIQSRGALENAKKGVESGATPDLLAVDLRAALTHLSHIVGIDISDEVLNNIFSKFCIGK